MVEDISKNWFVLYTKPRNELKVVERLRSNGVEAYTPTRTEVRQWSDRTKKSKGPFVAVDGLSEFAREASRFGI